MNSSFNKHLLSLLNYYLSYILLAQLYNIKNISFLNNSRYVRIIKLKINAILKS